MVFFSFNLILYFPNSSFAVVVFKALFSLYTSTICQFQNKFFDEQNLVNYNFFVLFSFYRGLLDKNQIKNKEVEVKCAPIDLCVKVTTLPY